MTTAQPGQEQRMEPVAWRWRYRSEGARWIFASTPRQAYEGDANFTGVEVDPLYLAPPSTRPTADLGGDGELVDWLDKVRTGTHVDITLHSGMAAIRLGKARDRLILYREALVAARPYVEANASRDSRMTAHHKGADVLDKIDGVLRSGG